MTTKYAISRLSNHGEVTHEGRKYFCAIKNTMISFIDQNNDVVCLYAQPIDQQDDPMTDYFCGSWPNNLKQAINWALND